jgi:hypothetical protein
MEPMTITLGTYPAFVLFGAFFAVFILGVIVGVIWEHKFDIKE